MIRACRHHDISALRLTPAEPTPQVPNVLLLDGHKFDNRIFVLVHAFARGMRAHT